MIIVEDLWVVSACVDRQSTLRLLWSSYWGWLLLLGLKVLKPQDALGHAQFLTQQNQAATNTLTDPALRRQAKQLYAANQRLFQSFLNLV